MYFLDEVNNFDSVIRAMDHQRKVTQFTTIIGIVISVLFFALVYFLIKKHDKKTGIKGSGFALFLTIITISYLVFNLGMIWFSDKSLFSLVIQFYVLGLPIAAYLFSKSSSFISGIFTGYIGFILGFLLWIFLQFFKSLGINIDFIVKIVATILTISSIYLVKKNRFNGFTRKNKSTYSRKHYSNLNTSFNNVNYDTSSSSNDFNLFGENLREEVDPLTGNVKYYNGYKQIGYGKKNICGDTVIYDMNHNKQLTKTQDYLFGEAKYKDNNYNTKYVQKGDFFGGSYVEDSNHNKVATHDSWDDIFSFGKNYKSK